MEGMSMIFDSLKSRLVLSGIFFFFLLFVFLEDASSVGAARKDVLLINSTDPALPFYKTYFAGIREACDQFYPDGVEIFQEFMEVVRINATEYKNSLPGFYKAKYASRNLAAIIATDPVDIKFMQQTIKEIFPGIPVIGRSDENSFNASGACFDLILHLQPTIKKLFIITGSHRDKLYLADIKEEDKAHYPNLEFVYIRDISFADLISTVQVLPANSAIIFEDFVMDINRLTFVNAEVAEKVSRVANCPMYGRTTTLIGHGIVGGALCDPREAGLIMGKKLLRVLYGESAVDEPAPEVVKLQVDEREMARWGLSESNLPPGYEVINRGHSIWRDYKFTLVVVLLFILVESVLIFSLLIQGRRKRKAEVELLGALERKNEAFKNLRESEATLDGILSSIPVGVLVVEAASRIIWRANGAAAKMLDNTPENLTGKPCPEPCNSCVLKQTQSGFPELASDSFESSILTESGEKIFIFRTVTGIMRNGKPYVIECFLDITAKKAAEREAQEKEFQLLQADKMISLGIMAAGIAHEINNPNSFISVNAPMLRVTCEGMVDRLDDYAEEKGDFTIGKLPYSRAKDLIPALFDGIFEGTERIRKIVNDMKDFIGSDPSRMVEEIDLNEIVRSSTNLLSNKLKKSTNRLAFGYGDGLPRFRGNPQQLVQVVVNLLLNAAEALPDTEKALTVRTFYDRVRKKVILQITDEGVGIEPENQKRIFDHFFTTKRNSGGTGLGLAISMKIVKAHGGEILIDSTPGEGTTATVELPVITAEPE
jgi:signal transduction histidine kinase